MIGQDWDGAIDNRYFCLVNVHEIAEACVAQL